MKRKLIIGLFLLLILTLTPALTSLAGTTTHFSWDYGTEGQDPWWTVWMGIFTDIDSDLYLLKGRVDNSVPANYSLGTCTTAKTIDPAVHGERQSVTLTHGQDCVLTFTKPSASCTAAGVPYPCCTAAATGVTCTSKVRLKIIQDTASAYNGTFSGAACASGGICWSGGVPATMTVGTGGLTYHIIACDLDETATNCVDSPDFK